MIRSVRECMLKCYAMSKTGTVGAARADKPHAMAESDLFDFSWALCNFVNCMHQRVPMKILTLPFD